MLVFLGVENLVVVLAAASNLLGLVSAVLTNGHTAWARARGPRIFFIFEGPQLAVMKYFFKLIILLPSQRSTVSEGG